MIGVCLTCLGVGEQEDHTARERCYPTITVPKCRACHQRKTQRQYDIGLIRSRRYDVCDPSPVERTFALYGGVVLDLAIAVPEFAEIEPLVIAHLGRWAVAQARATGQAFRFHPNPLRIPPRPSQRSSS